MIKMWMLRGRKVVIMEFIAQCEDFGCPEINVMGIASIERISEAQIRVTYFTQRKSGVIAQVHLIWDLTRILEYGWRPFEEMRAALLSHTLEEEDSRAQATRMAN
jgi:hypothetical protein